MQGTGSWIFGGLTGLIGLIGLIVAAHAHEQVFYFTGVVLFVFAVALVLATIKTCFDRQAAHGS